MPYNPSRHEERRLIVECPRCRARYRVESDVLAQDQTFKCSRCSHIFAHEAQSTIESPAPLAKPLDSPPLQIPPPEVRREGATLPKVADSRRSDGESLAFRFSGVAQPAAASVETVPPPPPPLSGRTLEQAPDYSFDDEADADSAVKVVDDEPAIDPIEPDDEPRFVRGEDDLRVEPTPAGRSGRAYVIYLTVLVIGFAILTLDLL